jgi:hypothetical protein
MDPKRARVIRGGLAVLAIAAAPVAIWALFAPHSFNDDFPGGGRHWVAPLGSYNEHLIRDVGAFELGLVALAIFAIVRLERGVAQAALLTFLVAGTPHLIFHAAHTDALSTADNVVELLGLALPVIIPLVLLPMTRARVPRTQTED